MSGSSQPTPVIPSDDELDFLTPKSRTAALSGATTPTLFDEPETPTNRMKLRTRQANVTLTISPTKVKSNLAKRKRVSTTLHDFSFTALPKPENVAKRAKLEDRKLHTIVINNKKVSIEAARRRWLHRHRDLFSPLLPSTNTFFEHLDSEMAESVDPGVYKPLRELEEQPTLIEGGTMKEYQLRGLSFLAWMYDNGMNCILGDEMGLGKTLQTLSLFAYVKGTAKASIDPHLIVCPLSVVDTWIREINRWLPSFRTLRFHAQESERARLKHAVRDGDIEFDICVTTYEGFGAEDGWFKSRRWTYFVLDEGHRIKNADTQIAHKVQGMGSMYRLILTGTPVQNNLVELWGLLHFLYPSIFTQSSERLFDEAFNLTQGTYAIEFLNAAEKLLSKIMLRRTKDSVENQISIPPREELTVFIPMTEAQRFWTYRLLTRMDTLDLKEIFAGHEDGDVLSAGREEVKAQLQAHLSPAKTGGNQWKRLMNLLIQLRQICDHPYLLPDVEPDPFVNGEHVVASSSKLIIVDKILADILPKGERVLIFSQWTGMLDLLEDFMALRDIKYARLDGSTPRPRRTLDIKLFQQENSPYQVFLVSTKAGGLGINLTKASTVIMFDSDWNPQNDLQAIARAHRIGQTQVVKVYRLICQGSVEDQMLDRIRRKLFLSLKVMNSNTTHAGDDDHANGLKRNELMSILRKGSSAISGTDSGLSLSSFLNGSVQSILEASRTHDNARAAKMKKDVGEDIQAADEHLLVDADEEEQKLLAGVAQVHSRLFEGKVVDRAVKSNKDIAVEWQQLQKRARKNRIVMVDGYEVLAELLGPEVSPTKPFKKIARTTKTFESEDWCMYCRDGGDLVLCSRCPRVLHPDCHGLSKAAMKKMASLTCPQHHCCQCDRGTADSGGMLFRCRTCPRAFCEDCLPPGEIDAIGDTIPEFLVLGYEQTSAAYYIQCHHCHERFKAQPWYKKQWEGEFQEADEKLAALRGD